MGVADGHMGQPIWASHLGQPFRGQPHRAARTSAPAVVEGEFVDALALVVNCSPGDFADPIRFGEDQLPEAVSADATGVLILV